MKQGHLLLIFLTIYCGCFILLYCEQKRYDLMLEEKQKTEHALLEAIEETANRYRMVINESAEKKKEAIAKTFSEAFYISMGFFQTTHPEDFWRIYVPMIVLVEEDGAYFYYINQANAGQNVLVHEWTDKVPFSLPDDYSEEVKKAYMAEVLESLASQIISNHNFIAKQYGVTYRYSVPLFFQDMSRELEFPMLFVVFQGWPLGLSGEVYYENCLDAGVFLREKAVR